MSSFLQVSEVASLRHLLLHSDTQKDGSRREALCLLHRKPDSWVAFWHKPIQRRVTGRTGPPTASISSVRAGRLPTTSFARELRQDAYVSINGFWRDATRKQDNLHSLNACWVDLDCGKTSNWQQAVESACALFEPHDGTEPVVPPPSLLVRSGRGLWMLWLLGRDPEDSTPPAATKPHKKLQRAINSAIARAILHRTPDLNPDLGAVDGARAIRVPGSVNTESAGSYYVQWIELTRRDGAHQIYTLGELAAFFEITPDNTKETQADVLPSAPSYMPKTARRSPAYRENWIRRWSELLAEFERIKASRNGFGEGQRNHAVFIHSLMCRRLSTPPDTLLEATRTLAAGCRPPLPIKEALDALNGASKVHYLIKNVTIAERLGVTVEEANRLGLRCIRPDFKAKEKPGKKPVKQLGEQRRRAISSILAEEGQMGLRALCRKLEERFNIRAWPETVRRDLRKIPPQAVGDLRSPSRFASGVQTGVVPLGVAPQEEPLLDSEK